MASVSCFCSVRALRCRAVPGDGALPGSGKTFAEFRADDAARRQYAPDQVRGILLPLDPSLQQAGLELPMPPVQHMTAALMVVTLSLCSFAAFAQGSDAATAPTQPQALGHSGAAEAEVQVEADANVMRISAQIATRVDRKTAWHVLSDFYHWADFVPDMRVSRAVSRPGEPLLVEQQGRMQWLPAFPLVVIAQVEEIPSIGLRFHRVAGNIKALQGEWRILGESPVHLTYRSTVEPGFPLPPQILTIGIFRQDAKGRLEAMAVEMARRANLDRQEFLLD